MKPSGDDHEGDADLDEQQRFRSLSVLTNHWSRPIGRPAFYWYLTFERSPELQAVASRCQQAIAFPYYDLTPLDELHLTLDRIAYEDEITGDQLAAIEASARPACWNMPRFEVGTGLLGGVSGAIGFTTLPKAPLKNLRDTVRAATLLAYPDAPVRRSKFHPHIAIAYANADGIPAADVIAVVENLNTTPARVEVAIAQVTLVRLERRPRSYAWQAVARLPLGNSEK